MVPGSSGIVLMSKITLIVGFAFLSLVSPSLSQCVSSTWSSANPPQSAVCPVLVQTSNADASSLRYVRTDPNTKPWTLNPCATGPKCIKPGSPGFTPVVPYDLDTPQEIPCTSTSRVCSFADSRYQCTKASPQVFQESTYYEIFPGSPAVCGHGNREFSFLYRQGTVKDRDKLLIAFVTGGMCWNADSCGMDPNIRTMSVDNQFDQAPAVPETFPQELQAIDSPFKQGIFDSKSPSNPFREWSVLIIPDCTGDLHIGNNSYTYASDDPTKCVTVHHKGAVNTGLAVQWILQQTLVTPTRVLALGTGPFPKSKASGGNGAAFWAEYLQRKLPQATIRVIIDSSLGIFGPLWRSQIQNDPWGTKKSMVPDASTNLLSDRDSLLPPPVEWSIMNDDMNTYYEWATRTSPKIAFADASSTDEAIQQTVFVQTGGDLADCCLDGCSCNFGVSTPASSVLPYSVRPGGPPFGKRGGQRDWTRTLKVTVLRRLSRMANNYRAWLVNSGRLQKVQNAGDPVRFLFTDSVKFGTSTLNVKLCPNPGAGGQVPSGCVLKDWAFNFTNGKVLFSSNGQVSGSTLSDSNNYVDDAFGKYVCDGCLSGIPGTMPMDLDEKTDDKCNATLGDAETLFTAAAAYNTDWMTLWSLNGGNSPDLWKTGDTFRFAHEYTVRKGETMEAIAARFGTSVDALLDLNYNQITNVYNPTQISEKDVICVIPVWPRAVDETGQGLCQRQ